jgi:hypothetical protein
VEDLSGLVRARPKSIAIRETWDTAFTLAAHSVHRFDPTVAITAEVVVPLDDPECMPDQAWADLWALPDVKTGSGRIGVLALVSNERESTRVSRGSPSISTDDALGPAHEQWTAFPIELPVKALSGEQMRPKSAHDGQDAVIRIATTAQRGDLRPILATAWLSTEVETFVFLTDVLSIAEKTDRRLHDEMARRIAEHMRKPEPERGEYLLLLRTELRTDIMENSRRPILLKQFTLEWPYSSDGSDVSLSVAQPVTVGGDAMIRREYDEHRFAYNSATGKVEIGGISIPLEQRSSSADGMQIFEVTLRLANTELQSQMHHLKAEMVLDFEGSILGIRPLFAAWNGEIIAGKSVRMPDGPSSSGRPSLKQTTAANIRMTINTREIFENQHYAFGYRLRLRGVNISSERIQYVRQILAERNMTLRAEGLGNELQQGAKVGLREWLILADRPIQGDRLILTSLVQCETRHVEEIEENANQQFRREAIGADTTIDVLGVLRGNREFLMNEVNAYVRELRHQIGRFASRR